MHKFGSSMSRVRPFGRLRKFSSSNGPLHEAPRAPKLSLYKRYIDALSENPFRVKIITAAFIFTTGDVATQVAEQTVLHDDSTHSSSSTTSSSSSSSSPSSSLSNGVSINVMRTVELASFGMLATTFIHCWWGLLEPVAIRLFDPVKQKFQHVLFKVFADQSFGGVCYNVIFFSVQGTVRGLKDNESIKDSVSYQLTNNLSPQLKNHWSFWPFFHFGNFWFNPLHQRVVWQNLASIGWGAVLSRVGEQNRLKEKAGAEDKSVAVKDQSATCQEISRNMATAKRTKTTTIKEQK